MPKHGPHRDPEAQQRILDATRELICERGPNQVSINEIASAANVGKQTIYRWWPSKAAVVVDALEQMIKAENPPPTTGSAYGDIQTQMRRVAQALRRPQEQSSASSSPNLKATPTSQKCSVPDSSPNAVPELPP